MPRFHFIIYDGIKMDDPRGLSLSSVSEAVAYAEELARLLLKEEVKHGQDRNHWSVVVCDDSGQLQHILHFGDVVEEPED